ncbi:hypothetical protein [Haloarcula litorea]|uniref:hypothetical protein n=1 Tax=Haloarcula litorea TaxID=3032579 RepID=UPI0023E79D17|nr:hypothetical protein [Halomicroarcula sp. GDY20]
MRRRRLLSTTALLAGTAGCLSAVTEDGTTRLGDVGIVNRDDERHTVEFRVRWDGETVHERAYEVAPDDPDDDTAPGVEPERTWPDTPGQFTVSARLSGGDWRTVDPAELDYPACLGVQVNVDPSGHLAVLHTTNENVCDSGE